MSSAFDASASTFEHHRSLPRDVPEAIRAAIWSEAGLSGHARVLDIGAGTGRIGKAFVNAGDSYFGIDTSRAMLQEFPVSSENCTLIQTDGNRLPFPDDSFDVVLLMQVLSGTSDWKGIVSEGRRVVRSGGRVAVGHTISPESGIDAQLKRCLKAVLRELNVDSFGQEQSRQRALEWLEIASVHQVHVVASSWSATVSPESFLQRHRTGAKFAALPAQVQERALEKLRTWAELTFGSLDAEFSETHSFELDIFEF